jgi:PIN domain nuclease of toxin-antitoxin system
MVYVPDTHAIIWFLDKDPRLSPAAKSTLANPNTVLIVPTMVLVEITHLYGRGRISVSPAVVKQKVLQSSLDIHDAIIVATALVQRDDRQQAVTLITKDTKITQSGLIQTLW